ncbi:argininosuccinate lyase [Chitinasiproducens palmae]|uniref:Argininosuccinate lyase n=1 Tax=Chitinasiproducens palmae TaxID=1770053 RepID=A0A1H2PJB3_9BURK|nr:argininosuccinate lyase [Chitinasiproducens palmae]SDV46434.1 argininosuccinate lyase [Chitinasiproducens palmae]
MNALRRIANIVALSMIGLAASAQAEESPRADATRIGRTSVPKAPGFQELYDFDAAAPTLADATFRYEVRVHRAHVVMLAEQGIVTRADAATILRGLDAVDARAARDPGLRTYLPYEAALIKEIGPVAGRMHTGRSRNDLANTVNRMYYRDQLNRTIEALIALRKAVVQKAADNVDTVMVVYTHRKEAQPITLGHYLMAVSESLGKSIDRYEQLYQRVNQSPLGAAASAGTGWPLNRERTAGLLGFDGLVVNTIEGTAGWDHIAEFASDNAIYLSGLGRLGSEIQLWTTDEYRSAELDSAYAGISSIMPQKKNPDSIERSRQIAANSVGALTSILTSLNAIEYQHSVARVPLEPRSIDALLAATHAMTGVVQTLHPNKQQMLRYAAENFSTMTDLADAIVRESGIDFREAHEIVARVVNAAIDAGMPANRIDAKMVQQAAQAQLGHPLNVSDAAIRDALDPTSNVARRNGVGGPAPAAVQRTIEQARRELSAEDARQSKRTQALAVAARQLDAAAAQLASQR